MAFTTTTGAGATVTITFECSNDNINWQAVPMFDAAAPTTAPVTSVAQVAATTRFWQGPVLFRWFRARISTVVAGGTVYAVGVFTQVPFTPATNQVAAAANWSSNIAQLAGTAPVTAGLAGTLAVGGNVAPGVTPTTNPLLIGGVDARAGQGVVQQVVGAAVEVVTGHDVVAAAQQGVEGERDGRLA